MSTGAEKAFDKIQHSFIIKIQQSTEGTWFNIIKAICEKPYICESLCYMLRMNICYMWKPNIIFSCESLKDFPLRSETKQGVHSHYSYTASYRKS